MVVIQKAIRAKITIAGKNKITVRITNVTKNILANTKCVAEMSLCWAGQKQDFQSFKEKFKFHKVWNQTLKLLQEAAASKFIETTIS